MTKINTSTNKMQPFLLKIHFSFKGVSSGDHNFHKQIEQFILNIQLGEYHVDISLLTEKQMLIRICIPNGPR